MHSFTRQLIHYTLTHLFSTHQVLGKLLVKNLTMRYTRWGTCVIDLVNENTKVLNSAAVTGIDGRKAAEVKTIEEEGGENNSEADDE